MTPILATRAARRRWISFLVLLVVSVVLMGISSNAAVHDVQNGVGFAFRPIQGALDEAARGVASIVAAVTDIDRLRTDNNALRSDNERLKVENARIGEIQRENQHLSALLGLRAGLDYQTVATTVIARESSEFRRLVVLDKGTDDGIALGDVVVAAGGGLAGRVVDVGPASAKVVLLTDSSSTVTGQLATNAATGEVVGQLGGVLLMRQVDAGETVSVGDEVVTAGIELGDGIRSPYPKGLLVGQVVDVKRDANAVVQTAYLEPAPPPPAPPPISTRSSTCSSSPTTRAVCRRSSSSRSIAGRAPSCPRANSRVYREARRRPPRRARHGARPRAPPRHQGGDIRRAGRARLIPFAAMKGIVLAGGTATRLYPLTIVTNKHLLPIYDRPMIYYPIETLASMGGREVMVIVGGKSVGDVVELLGDGSAFGLDLTYRYQAGAQGIAQAIGLARDFVGDDAFCCVLGDNILRGPALAEVARDFDGGAAGAGTLLYRVPDPQRFGVAELDASGNVIGFEEKPEHPKSD